MIVFKDKNSISLILSAFAVSLSLLWLVLGQDISNVLFEDSNKQQLYMFVSGAIFSLALFSILVIIKIILNYTEFLIQKDDLPALIYKSAMNEGGEGVFFKDLEGRYRLINDVARSVLNLNQRDVIGKKDRHLYNSFFAKKIENEDRNVLFNGESFEWQTVINNSHNKSYFLCTKAPCLNSKGKIIGITGIFKNITNEKVLTSVKIDIENRYRDFFNKLPYPVLIVDAVNMMPVSFNGLMCDLLSYDSSEFEKLRLSVHVADESIIDFREIMYHILNEGKGEFDLKLKTKDIRIIEVSGYGQDVEIDNKHFLHIVFHDVTDINKSTNDLIHSELKYRSLFEHASDVILIINKKTLQIVDANEVAVIFLNYSTDELKSMTLLDLDDSIDHKFTQNYLNELEIYNHVIYEHLIRSRSGEVFHVEVNAHKVNYGNDEVYQYVLRDITKRKQIELSLKQSERRYRQMFESNQAIKLVINPDLSRIEDANSAAAEFYGYDIEEFRGMNLSNINVLSVSKLKRLMDQSREMNIGFYSCPHKLKNGEIRFVEVRDGPMEIDNKTLLYSIVHDVTTNKQVEDQLVLASKMFDYSTEAVMITDKENIITSVNRAFTEITGYKHSEIISLSPAVIMAGRDDQLINNELVKHIEQEGQWQGEIWHRLKSGDTRPLKATINIVKDKQGEIINHVVSMSASLDSISSDSVASFKSLTGLPNKNIYVDRLINAIERSQRLDKQLAVLLIDFEKFSLINKKYGYDAGDLVLQAIARRLKSNVRESDMVSHFCKDDFAVLLEDISSVEQAGIVAQKTISTLSEVYQVEDKAIKLKVSIGISLSPDDGVEADMLLGSAEEALQKAQNNEASHFEFISDALNNNAQVWLKTDESLHIALKNDDFFVSYLPLIKVERNSTTRIIAFEALVRWRTENSNVLCPEYFLPNAELSGFISAIGYKVIDKALYQLHLWKQEGVQIEKIGLNISCAQVDADFCRYLIEKCNEYNLSYNSIALDFSENNFEKCGEDAIAILNKLKSKGFYICIDDFGKGKASLMCLMKYPINAIKIDRVLIDDLGTNEDTYKLLKGILALAEEIDIDCIAEGVETELQYNKLIELGCQHMQGYYFNRPLQGDELKTVISKMR